MNELPSLDGFFEELQRFNSYHYDLFISYSRKQETSALELARALDERGLEVFYAPEDLRKFMLDGGTGQYTRPLQDALIRSCHCLALVSESYVESSWCMLELWGFFNLQGDEPRRHLIIYTLDSEKQVPSRLRGLIFRGRKNDLADHIADLSRASTLARGQKLRLSPKIEPFTPLPLREFYEPPGAAPSPPWKKDSRSPHGHPAGPPYDLYEDLVREYMIQIKRGYMPGTLKVEIEGLAVDYTYIAKRAQEDAEKMINLAISPFSGMRVPSLGLMMRDVEQAEKQGNDSPELFARKGLILLHMGLYKLAVRDLTTALDKQAKMIPDWVADLARAYWGKDDPQGGLDVIEKYQPDPDVSLLRAKAVCLIAVGRQTEAHEIAAQAMTQAPDYSLADERLNSYYENDDELERWLTALSKAGFQ